MVTLTLNTNPFSAKSLNSRPIAGSPRKPMYFLPKTCTTVSYTSTKTPIQKPVTKISCTLQLSYFSTMACCVLMTSSKLRLRTWNWTKKENMRFGFSTRGKDSTMGSTTPSLTSTLTLLQDIWKSWNQKPPTRKRIYIFFKKLERLWKNPNPKHGQEFCWQSSQRCCRVSWLWPLYLFWTLLVAQCRHQPYWCRCHHHQHQTPWPMEVRYSLWRLYGQFQTSLWWERNSLAPQGPMFPNSCSRSLMDRMVVLTWAWVVWTVASRVWVTLYCAEICCLNDSFISASWDITWVIGAFVSTRSLPISTSVSRVGSSIPVEMGGESGRGLSVVSELAPHFKCSVLGCGTACAVVTRHSSSWCWVGRRVKSE